MASVPIIKASHPLISVNDKPKITASNVIPIEGRDNVTLTCQKATTGQVNSVTWYKNNNKITSTRNELYVIGNNRSNAGNYSCDITIQNNITSLMSDNIRITFICKY